MDYDYEAKARELLAEGERVVEKIKTASENSELFDDLDAVRDRLGKQAHGIWLQAQVHATLHLAQTIAYKGLVR